MEKQIYKIDASGGKIGRIAARAANLLMGKNLVTYARNKFPDTQVIVENVSKIDIPEKRLVQKSYKKYSGYPGGLREMRMEQVIEKKGKGAILKIAISGMLPRNKLKSRIIRNLVIKD